MREVKQSSRCMRNSLLYRLKYAIMYFFRVEGTEDEVVAEMEVYRLMKMIMEVNDEG